MENEKKKKQDIKDAVKLLQRYKRWRRGADIEMPRPKEIGKAIDTAIEYIKKNEKLEEI